MAIIHVYSYPNTSQMDSGCGRCKKFGEEEGKDWVERRTDQSQEGMVSVADGTADNLSSILVSVPLLGSTASDLRRIVWLGYELQEAMGVKRALISFLTHCKPKVKLVSHSEVFLRPSQKEEGNTSTSTKQCGTVKFSFPFPTFPFTSRSNFRV